VQGAGWACLVWYGAVRGGGATIATWLAGLFVVGFVVIVNSVHGGLRDLRNDSARGMRTTAIAFGATVSGDSVTVPPALRALAWLLQAGLAGLAVISPLGVHGFGWWIVWYVGCLATTAAAVLLLREGLRSSAHPDAPIRSRSSSADPARFMNIGAAHILALWIPLTAMTAMYGGVVHFLAALAAMVVPMLGNQDFRTAFAALPGLARELRPHVMTAATRARHGVARVAADIRSRVGSRS